MHDTESLYTDTESKEGVILKERLTWRDCVKHMAKDVREELKIELVEKTNMEMCIGITWTLSKGLIQCACRKCSQIVSNRMSNVGGCDLGLFK